MLTVSGKYSPSSFLVETKAKDGYILDSTPHEVKFTYEREVDCDGKTGDNFNPCLCGLVRAMFIGFAISYIYCSKHTDMFDDAEEDEEEESISE